MPDLNELNRIKDEAQRWESTTLKKTLDRFPERQERFVTTSSAPVERLYTPADIDVDTDYLADIGFPGEYPYTRGVHATLYRGKPWTMRMFAGFGSAEETNARYKYLLSQGQPGLSVAFDLPTLMGYDTDAPQALGEFGKCGVAISSPGRHGDPLRRHPSGQVTTSMTINSPAAIIWAMYIAAAEKQGVPPAGWAARCKTTSSRSTSRRRSSSSRRALDAVW
jgi:methylmalonyl-CoA mutase N-terminal domain/subunit